MKKEHCHSCGVEMDELNNPFTRNCGGDCLKCMAESGDTDCKAFMDFVNEPIPDFVKIKQAKQRLINDQSKYRAKRIFDRGLDGVIEYMNNSQSAQGWELVSVHRIGGEGSIIILRREKV